jgi:hypothetical protein
MMAEMASKANPPEAGSIAGTPYLDSDAGSLPCQHVARASDIDIEARV